MKVREAALDDAPAISGLVRELGYAGVLTATTERLARLLRSDADAVFVAEDAGCVVGWVQAQASGALESGFRTEIGGLGVGAQDRRRGWGERLVAVAEEWGRARGAEGIVVRSDVRRVESHEFYPALGYEKAKVQAVYCKSLKPAAR